MSTDAHVSAHAPKTIARWWGVDPQDVVSGNREGLSAALWNFAAGEHYEVTAAPDPAIHIIALVLAGQIKNELFLDGIRRHCSQPMRAGTFNLVRAGEHPRAINRSEGCTFLHMYLPAAVLRRCAEDYSGSASPAVELLSVTVGRDLVIERIARLLHDEMRAPALGSRMIVDGLTLQLAGHMVRRWSNLSARSAADRELARGGLAPWQFKCACEAMDARLGGDIGLDELAAVAGCSPTHFSRAFKQTAGVPPFKWLLQHRIKRAQELLTNSRISVAEVALAVGFAAQPQFSTAFRRVTGTTPGAWRRERLR